MVLSIPNSRQVSIEHVHHHSCSCARRNLMRRDSFGESLRKRAKHARDNIDKRIDEAAENLKQKMEKECIFRTTTEVRIMTWPQVVLSLAM